MAQINLLKQQPTSYYKASTGLVVKFLLVVLLGIIAYYGWLYFQLGQTGKQILQYQASLASDSESALTNPKRNELLTRQLQLQNFDTLLSKHVYWSQLFSPLAAVTLRSATYSDVKIGSDGTITLSATVPTLEDLDRYLQIFNLPQVYKNFSNVKISDFSQTQGKNSSMVRFDVVMTYNPSLIQYQTVPNSSLTPAQ